MIRQAWIGAAAAVLVGISNVAGLSADLPEPAVAEKVPDFVPLTAEEVAKFVQQLRSPRYAERAEATRRLAEGGRDVVAPLHKAAQSDGSEAATRAVRVLESLFVNGSKETSEAAEIALEELARADDSGPAEQAASVLALNYKLRERRALAEIERLGGVVRYGIPGEPQFGEAQREFPPQHVIIPLDWKGGDEGVRYLKRLDRLAILYPVRKELADGSYKATLSEKQVGELQAALPRLRIEWRGPACLGVSGTDVIDIGCELRTVDPKMAAGRAGLKDGDLLTHFDGVNIRGFADLVRLIGRHEPGDKVPCQVRRGNETLDFVVELDGWN